MVLKLTQNRGVDYVILCKNVPNRLPELLADGAKIINTENTDISILSSKFIKTYFFFVIKILTIDLYNDLFWKNIIYIMYIISIFSDSSSGFEVISTKFENIPIFDNELVDNIHSFIESKIKLNHIKPLPITVFSYADVETAFR